MKALCFALLIPLFSIKQTTAQQDACPPWFIPDNTSSTGCSCQGLDEVIKCGLDFPLLHLGFCMTYNSTTETTAFGPCPYIAQYITFVNCIQLPENVSLLNEFMCWPLNREGPFLLLSFSKILFVSFTLLYTFHIYYPWHRTHFGEKCVLYYDPTVECHTQENSIFAAIAGCVLVIFIVSPTILLILYPTRLFRRFITCCGFRRWHALHMFVESFQGQYKDGTNGTRDFRMVSTSFLILRILDLVSFLKSHHPSSWISSDLRCVLFVSAACFYAVMRPYKSNFRNNIDFLILILLGMLSLTTLTHFGEVSEKNYTLHSSCISTGVRCSTRGAGSIYLFVKTGITQCLKGNCKRLATRCTSRAETDEFATGSLPDRLINPEEYTPAPTTSMKHTPDAELRENTEPVDEEPRRLTPVYTYGSIN